MYINIRTYIVENIIVLVLPYICISIYSQALGRLWVCYKYAKKFKLADKMTQKDKRDFLHTICDIVMVAIYKT